MSRFYGIFLILCLGYLCQQVYEQRDKIYDLTDVIQVSERENKEKIDLLEDRLSDIEYELKWLS